MQDETLALSEVLQLLKIGGKAVCPMVPNEHPPAYEAGGRWGIERIDPGPWIELIKAARDQREDPL